MKPETEGKQVVVFRGEAARINGRVAFPDRRLWGARPPRSGEEWEVEIVGENPRGTVYFLRAVRSPEQIEADRRAEEARREAEEKARTERELRAAREFFASYPHCGTWEEFVQILDSREKFAARWLLGHKPERLEAAAQALLASDDKGASWFFEALAALGRGENWVEKRAAQRAWRARLDAFLSASTGLGSEDIAAWLRGEREATLEFFDPLGYGEFQGAFAVRLRIGEHSGAFCPDSPDEAPEAWDNPVVQAARVAYRGWDYITPDLIELAVPGFAAAWADLMDRVRQLKRAVAVRRDDAASAAEAAEKAARERDAVIEVQSPFQAVVRITGVAGPVRRMEDEVECLGPNRLGEMIYAGGNSWYEAEVSASVALEHFSVPGLRPEVVDALRRKLGGRNDAP